MKWRGTFPQGPALRGGAETSHQQGINRPGWWPGPGKEGAHPDRGPAYTSTCSWGFGASLQGQGEEKNQHPGASGHCTQLICPSALGPVTASQGRGCDIPSRGRNAEAQGGCPPCPTFASQCLKSEGERQPGLFPPWLGSRPAQGFWLSRGRSISSA